VTEEVKGMVADTSEFRDNGEVRPQIWRRVDYVVSVPAETFIVPLLRDHISNFIRSLGVEPGNTVLDVGCGNQPFRALVEAQGLSYVGMDVSQSAVLPVDFIAHIDRPLPKALEEAGPFDVIICTEVMEHVADWAEAFRNFSILLSDDGVLLLTCPHFYPLHEEPFDYWRPTRYAIEHYANTHGLQIRESLSLGSALDVLGTLLGNIYFKSQKRGVLSFLSLWSCKIARRFLFAILKHGFLQERVESTGFFLSNFAILTRTSRRVNGVSDAT
jgi:SAM-dependent methyltransferase